MLFRAVAPNLRRGAFGHVRNLQLLGGAPEAFQVVVAAGLFAKDVHDEAAEIEQRPFGGALALAMFRRAFEILVQLLLDFGANGLNLRRAESGANDKVFRERAKTAQLKHGNSRGFFVLRGFDGEAHSWGKRFEFHR